MRASKLAEQARAALGPAVLRQGGRVFYSEPGSLEGRAATYYLGINPRDAASSNDPDHHSVRTIDRDLALFAEGRASNAFLDECWKGHDRGMAELQRRVRTLAGWAGIDGDRAFRRMPASNVIFVRTAQQPRAKQFAAWVKACWPVHAMVLKATAATLILVGGTHAGEAVVESLGGLLKNRMHHEKLRTANYSISVYRTDSHVVVALPPLPRWKGMEKDDAEATRAVLARFAPTATHRASSR